MSDAAAAATLAPSPGRSRIEWLDYAKGTCIILVVMLYSVEVATERLGCAGWIGRVADFARPFRMPDFFLLSGLLLPRVIDRPWRRYLDRKVVHFAYFYVLWVTILVAYRGLMSAVAGAHQDVLHVYLASFVKPFSMLWFIYMLAIFFVVTKALRSVPAWLTGACAAALFLWQPPTEIKILEKFMQYYVFFFTGYALSARAFRYADLVRAHAGTALVLLLAWGLANGALVLGGYSRLPGLNLAMALVGSGAVIAFGVLLSRVRAGGAVAYCGAHSIVIYLAFYIPLTLTAKVLVAAHLVRDGGWLGAWSTASGVLGALALYWAVRRSFLSFLFERPAWLSIDRGSGGGARSARPEAMEGLQAGATR